MSITSGELAKAVERTRMARKTLKFATLVKEHCHGVADHVLALSEHPQLYPKGWTEGTYLELQLELGLLDSTFGLVEKELKHMERGLAEATEILTEAIALEKLNQTPPTKNGMSIEEAFDAEVANVHVRSENIVTLNVLYMDRVKTVRDMLGI